MVEIIKKACFKDENVDLEDFSCFKTEHGNWLIGTEGLWEWEYLVLNSLGKIKNIYHINSDDLGSTIDSFNEYMLIEFNDELIEAYVEKPSIAMIKITKD